MYDDELAIELIFDGNDGEAAFIAALADALYADYLDNVNTYSYDRANGEAKDHNSDRDATAIHALDRQSATRRLEAA